MDSWNLVVARHAARLAFWHPAAPSGVTFAEIDRMAGDVDVSGSFVVAVGSCPGFFSSLVAAWRAGKPALLVENATSTVRPIEGGIPVGTVLIKQTCGASGLERSLFFGVSEVLAEGRRNIAALGLHPDRRGLAAVSLAHSYGFGCLALPLLLGGIPVDILAGPMPMFMHGSLARGGEVFLPGVPAMWKSWWQTHIVADPAIGLALCAGSPLSLELEVGVHGDCGLKIHNFYGTSETGAIAYDDSDELRSSEHFVGRALGGMVVGADGSGRITVNSDSRALGTDVAAWEGEFSSPVYQTLDRGAVVEDGVFVHDCIGQAINVAGRKMSPVRLRGILEQLDGVLSAVVERGRSRDYERFEEIRVLLTVKPGYDKRILREALRQRVESWEMPRHWEFETV
ncbi:MAG: AMP-binding protein [Luteolibacter sp.]